MKLHKLLIILGLSAAATVGFTSCEDFLKEEPYSFIGPDEVGNDDAAVNQWVTGVYSKWANDIFRWDNFPRVLEMDCDYTSGPDWAFSNIGAGNFQGDEVATCIWDYCYNLINRANVAIKYVGEITGASEKVKNNALGELYFNKAFAYFLLVRAYGEIPLFDVSIMEGAGYHQKRESVPTVYGEITRLLDNAYKLMYTNDDSAFQPGHVSAGSALGLIAKVYATMASGAMPAGEQIDVKTGNSYTMNGDEKVLTLPVVKTFSKNQVAGYESFDWRDCYTKAVGYVELLMSGDYGTYELLPYDQLWKRSSYNKGEHMFMLNAINGDEEYGNQIHKWFCGTQDAQGIIQSGQWIGNRYHWYTLFDNSDQRVVNGVQHRWRYAYQVEGGNGFYYPKTPEYTLMATGIDANGQYVDGYPVAPFNDGVAYIYNTTNECLAFTTKFADVSDKQQPRSDAYWPFLRYADVLLIYAEAKCELGDGVSAEAISVLNEVRRRSKAREATVTGDGAITTKTNLRSAIIEERAKELALEGDRRWDLIRWGIYIDVMNSVGGTSKDGAQVPYDEAGVNKYRENKHLLFPIPNKEVSANDAIDSNNPGWS